MANKSSLVSWNCRRHVKAVTCALARGAPSLLCVMFFLISSSAYGSENVRVVIADNQQSVTLASPSGLIVEGERPGRGERKMTFGPASVGARPLRVRSKQDFTGVNGRSYRGWIEVRKKKNGTLLLVNDLDIEEYLMGVVAEEIPSTWEFEALKAQAIASRTYALYQKKRSGKRPYHIRATINSQIYSGRRGERDSTVRAVRETEGMVIVYNGELIPAFYHSSCGGHTEAASELWGIDAPYLKGVDCDCQEISRYGLWEKRFSISSLLAALGKMGYRLKGISSIAVGTITPAGRVKEVTVRHAGGASSVPAETLRAAVGYAQIPSVFFETAMSGGEVIVSGRGLGHGVGLCQWGAREMARRGHDFKSILGHYYPGTSLAKSDRL
jgi:stage II sporulation protein D